MRDRTPRDAPIASRALLATRQWVALDPFDHVDDLDQSFQDIGDELRNQYSIAYIPTHSQLDGKYHKIRIDVPEHKGYQVRARRGYFAKANNGGPAGTNPSGSAN